MIIEVKVLTGSCISCQCKLLSSTLSNLLWEYVQLPVKSLFRLFNLFTTMIVIFKPYFFHILWFILFFVFYIRLVHVFSTDLAGDNCFPLTTLDNHSSSVTAIGFTSDGKRLITCGGDKIMVFNSVEGDGIKFNFF